MAIISMTGFGEAKVKHQDIEIQVELKSVNHRFLDISSKLPTLYYRYENQLQKVLRETIKRGRVDIFINRLDLGEPEYKFRFNQALFQSYLEFIREALKTAGIKQPSAYSTAVIGLLHKKEILEFVTPESKADLEFQALEQAFKIALSQLVKMRTEEGAALQIALMDYLSGIESITDKITLISKSLPEAYKERLQLRLERLAQGIEVESSRIAQEVVILADRIDITEELVRLKSHIEQSRAAIKAGEGGRKLEFLLQEIGREINTIGSKAQNAEISLLVVESKTLIEKFREQIQNIE